MEIELYEVNPSAYDGHERAELGIGSNGKVQRANVHVEQHFLNETLDDFLDGWDSNPPMMVVMHVGRDTQIRYSGNWRKYLPVYDDIDWYDVDDQFSDQIQWNLTTDEQATRLHEHVSTLNKTIAVHEGGGCGPSQSQSYSIYVAWTRDWCDAMGIKDRPMSQVRTDMETTAKTFRQIWDGEVFNVEIEEQCPTCGAWSHVDSCSGYIGTDHDNNGLLDFIRTYVRP